MPSVRLSVHSADDFKVDDRVELIAPFRCQGDSEDADREWDGQIKPDKNGRRLGTIISFERDGGHVFPVVNYDGYQEGRGSLLTDANRLEFEVVQVSNEEVEEAIRSILGT